MVVTVRVSSQISFQCKDLAKNFGWQLADLLRTLICVGGIFAFLTTMNPDREKAASVVLGGLRLLKPSSGFSLRLPSDERPYAFRIQGRKSSLLTLSLPASVCDLVALYAEMMKASRNQAYYKLLQQGLLIYLKAQTSLLEASR